MATAKKIFPLVLLGLTSIPTWGQSGSKGATPNGPQVFDAPRVTTAAADATPLAVPSSYLIGPEDVLRIEVFRDNDYSRAVSVRPDGKITLPLVGDIQAEGLTPERLGTTIKEALSQFNKTPEVTITVLDVRSKSFSVTGRVNRVGRWPLVTPVRVFDALGLAGGLLEFANEKNIQIIHADGTSSKFNYKDFLKRKKEAIDQNIFLQNGDAVVIK